ncbi:PREDICTED: uncharacterized protein LOC106813497 [Priapulus caudatus]|uniref:Uncharacterized protein LOC106813497 n=1 Tax=Priapulus caudatus TaxID=37621 RepID=A0ABM1ELQ5_PRICU|nr:PREDICTED: uncharacterized protein LOC106813497 [Priapulus caudatus]
MSDNQIEQDVQRPEQEELAAGDAQKKSKETANGIENPFRPGGSLDHEADVILDAIKHGRPLTPTGDMPVQEEMIGWSATSNVSSAPPGGHGDAVDTNQVQLKDGQTAEVEGGVVTPAGGGAEQAEKVTIEKKPKKCCTIL